MFFMLSDVMFFFIGKLQKFLRSTTDIDKVLSIDYRGYFVLFVAQHCPN